MFVARFSPFRLLFASIALNPDGYKSATNCRTRAVAGISRITATGSNYLLCKLSKQLHFLENLQGEMITINPHRLFQGVTNLIIPVDSLAKSSRYDSARLALRKILLPFALILITILLPALLAAQTDLSDVIGTPPDLAAYQIPGLGFVNMRNGNLHIEFPLRTVKDRNGTTITTNLTYDNSDYFIVQVPLSNGQNNTWPYWASTPSPSQASGPNFWESGLRTTTTSPNQSGRVNYTTTYLSGCSGPYGYGGDGGSGVTCTSGDYYSNWQYIEGNGTIHPFPATATTAQATLATPIPIYPQSLQTVATDRSGYWLSVANGTEAIVYDLHGNQVVGSGDTNGNQSESFGRSDDIIFCNSTVITNCFGYTLKTIYVWTNLGGATADDIGPISANVMSSITLPDGRTYQFQYDDAGPPAGANGTFLSSQQGHYGSLTSITLPTGGQISIQSEVLPYSNPWYNIVPFVVQQVATPDGTWSFSYNGIFLATSPVDPQTGLATQTVFENGSGTAPDRLLISARGTTLRTVTKQDTIPGVIETYTTTLDNGQSSKVVYTYADICTPRISSKKEYDFSGNLMRETDVSYFTNAADNTNLCPGVEWYGNAWNDPYLQNGHHIIDIPSSVTVYGAGGCCTSPIAQTNYTYDSTPLSTTSGSLGNSVLGLPTHDDADFGTSMTLRGNLTGVSQMISPGNFITTKTNYYNILGELVKTADGNGNATNFDYTDNWNDASCIPSPEYAYPTTVTNALGQQIKTAYNSCDGSVASVQDQNDINAGRAGTVYTYDGLQRITNTSYPDGGNTAVNYGGSEVPEVITTTTTATPSPSQVSSATLDGMGRTVTAVAPSGATVNTIYDTQGRVHTVSNPYFSTSDPTYGLTTYTYDALNRKTQQLDSDGVSKQTWSYSGSTVTFSDENGNQWQRTSDALGRLTTVLEPNGTTSTPSMETDYSYDALNNLLTVNQRGNGSTDTPRTRNFTYDSLSRLIQAYNPESGYVCYGTTRGAPANGSNCISGYDSDGNLGAKTDARGITVSYSYDNLNRLYAKSYSSGDPSVCTQYDNRATGSSDSNPLGMLTAEWTAPAGTLCPYPYPSTITVPTSAYNSTVVMQHDAMGRVNSEQQCPQASNCATPYSFNYNYDLAGNLILSNNGIPSASTALPPLTWSSAYNSGGELDHAAMQSQPAAWSGNGSTSQYLINPTLVQATPASGYDPFGHLVNASLGISAANPAGAITVARQYDKRGRILSEMDGSGAASATGSTGQILLTGTESGPLTFTATPGSAVVTITGSDTGTQQSCITVNEQEMVNGYMTVVPETFCSTVPATGNLSVTVNGFTATAYYNSTTDTGIAQELTASFNVSGSPVTAVQNGASVTITAIVTGAATNYPITVSNGNGYTITDPRSAMSGGQNGATGLYDSGTVTATITNTADSPTLSYTTLPVAWGQSDTTSTIAARLASAINTAAGSLVSASANGGTINLTSTGTGAATDYVVAVNVNDSMTSTYPALFPSPSFQATATRMTGGDPSNIIYSYTVPTGANPGYDPVGNLKNSTDFVMGTWGYTYDTLNRLTAAQNVSTTALSAPYAGAMGCWNYDSFGNRTLEAYSNATSTPCASGANDNTVNKPTPMNTTLKNNQLSPSVASYDAAGNVVNDGLNLYAYDSEGRLCAVENSLAGSAMQYVYDASGARVARGAFAGSFPTTNTSCPAPGTGNTHFTPTNQYLLGPGGEQVTELVVGTTYGGTKASGTFTFAGTEQSKGEDLPYQKPFTAYDSGTFQVVISSASAPCSVNVNYFVAPSVAPEPSIATPTDLATSLASQLNSQCGTLVSATANGATVTVTSTTPSASADYSISAALTSSDRTDFPTPSFTLTASGPAMTGGANPGLPVTETSWQHTNVYAGGALLATYDKNGLHFHLSDPLGTRRVQVSGLGQIQETCQSLPFGSGLSCTQNPALSTADDATEHHFTGKERDSESGNDYFEARYYASSMGRFLSPDDVIITPERLTNPQQLNLYAYVANNPLRYIDPTGEILQCVGDADSQKQCFSDLQQIAGDAANRLSMDAKTGVVSFDTKDLDMSKNEGAALVNDLVGSKNTYDFSVGPTVMTDKGPVRVDHIGLDIANLPAFGNQRQIGNPPAGVSDILDLYLNNPNIQRGSNTNLQVAPGWTVAFHELAEAFEKIDGGKGGSYEAGHNAALQRELKLRDQRPYLKGYNTGSGGPANSPNPEGKIIIKK